MRTAAERLMYEGEDDREFKGSLNQSDHEARLAAERMVMDDCPPATPPLFAEKVAFDLGLPSFSQVRDVDRHRVMEANWTWIVATGWIAWGSDNRAEQVSAYFDKWRGRICRDAIARGQRYSYADAGAVLQRALATGVVSATGIRDGQRMPIERDQWPDLKWNTNEQGEVLEFDALLWEGVLRYTKPRLEADQVRSVCWSGEAAAACDETAVAALRARNRQLTEQERRQELALMKLGLHQIRAERAEREALLAAKPAPGKKPGPKTNKAPRVADWLLKIYGEALPSRINVNKTASDLGVSRDTVNTGIKLYKEARAARAVDGQL